MVAVSLARFYTKRRASYISNVRHIRTACDIIEKTISKKRFGSIGRDGLAFFYAHDV